MDKYNSKFALCIGKLFFKTDKFAITTSKVCTRYSCAWDKISIEWARHEHTHKRQIAELGWLNFMLQYLLESIIHGYKLNKFEVEARAKEKLS